MRPVLHGKWANIILALQLLIFSTAANAQCEAIPNASTGISLQCVGSTVNRSGIAYHPTFHIYYSVTAGNPDYPIETFSNTGEPLSTLAQGFDYRGLWWNANTNQLEGNGFASLGIFDQNLDAVTGYPLGTGTTLYSPNLQPDVQSIGDYDPVNNQIIYYFNGNIYQYNKTNNTLDATIPITGLPVDISNINTNSIFYTGCSGKEYAVYDYTNQRIYFISNAGAYVSASQLPASAPQRLSFGASWSNGLIWIFDVATYLWQSYDVLTPPLPLKITYISASYFNKTATVLWSSENELNVNKFILERSSDGENFEEIATISAKGEGSNKYTYSDVGLQLKGMVYYRLKVYDKNGKFVYSKTVNVSIGNGSQLFSIAPNPASYMATISFASPIEQGEMAIYSITGTKILAQRLAGQMVSYKLNTQLLPAGIYMVEVKTPNASYQQKLVITK